MPESTYRENATYDDSRFALLSLSSNKWGDAQNFSKSQNLYGERAWNFSKSQSLYGKLGISTIPETFLHTFHIFLHISRIILHIFHVFLRRARMYVGLQRERGVRTNVTFSGSGAGEASQFRISVYETC